MCETADELLVGLTQSSFGIELQMPRDVGHHEKHVTEFFFYCRFRLASGEPAGSGGLVSSFFFSPRINRQRHRFEFGDLLLELVEDGGQVRPVEADLRGFVLQLDSARQRGQGDRNVGEYRGWNALLP